MTRRRRKPQELPDLTKSQCRWEQFNATWADVSAEEEGQRRERAARLISEGYGKVWLAGESSSGEIFDF